MNQNLNKQKKCKIILRAVSGNFINKNLDVTEFFEEKSLITLSSGKMHSEDFLAKLKIKRKPKSWLKSNFESFNRNIFFKLPFSFIFLPGR